ncbi:bifunctional diguanylate cyclase/phosphodiesterase [Chitinimonas koreensis]|uniref:bifunctional diguanylate cyclase/phosphodiesterase n=1 Tax=Chitinimonas koreensis TaxID=356302 RepID=UPI0003FD352C|nr:EAL domain-containing protein [Chitinimonas koreensis]QNM96052.1 EAL domain-containing protein [Chitinimonas koreensis]
MNQRPQSSSGIFDRFAALMLLLLLALLCGLAWLMLRTADQQNLAAIRAEETLVRALLDQSRRQLPPTLYDYAQWDDMYRRVGLPAKADLAWFDESTTETIHSKLKIDLMLLVDVDGRVDRLMYKGKLLDPAGFDLARLPDWRALIDAVLRQPPAGEATLRDLAWNDHAYWVAAQRIAAQSPGPQDGRRALLFARRVDTARMLDLLAAQRLPDLALHDAPRPEAACVAATPLTGVQARYLCWTPIRSGSAFLQALALPATLLILLMVGLCYALLLDGRQRHRALQAKAERQAGQRGATVALVGHIYTHRHDETQDEAAFWRGFARLVGQTLRVRRVHLLLYTDDADGVRTVVDLDVAADRPAEGKAPRRPADQRQVLAERYLLVTGSPNPGACAAIMRDGKLIGELSVEHGGTVEWASEDANFLVTAAALAALSLESSTRRGVEHSLHRQVYFDPLTGLSSALRLSQELDSRRTDWTGAVVVAVVRIEGLEDINLLYGREAGDRLLVILAGRLTAALGDDELAARSGGKRFDLLFHAGDAESGRRRLADLEDRLGAPCQLDSGVYRPQCRIGAVFCNAGVLSLARLQEASLALDYAQHSNQDKVVWYDARLRALSERRLALAQALRQALSQGGLSLVYQPYVDAHSGQPVGAEVLLRWTHAAFGAVSPAEFIPIAEESGLIGELGDWVVDTALAQLRRWRDELPVVLKLAINLSPRQLADPALALRLFTAMARHDVGCSGIEFEVTEGLALESSPVITANLQALQAAEIDIAIDDFGTGYATFSYLRRYKVEKIKLDKLFIDGVNDEAAQLLVRSMITMGKGLGAGVTAEGVEHEAQWRLLRDMGCDYIQGYYFGRPMAAEAFEKWVDERMHGDGIDI